MSYLGENEIPFPQSKNADFDDAAGIYATIMRYIDLLYNKAELVHGDLSEFNILYSEKPYLIDMGQSVTRDHPRAYQFLMRDIRNINRFFKNRCVVRNDVEIFNSVTGLDTAEP